jgi:Zn-dependent peptidase ImmA (M78 family)
MTKFVPFVPAEAIEKDAQALLAEYARARGVVIQPPIAIDDIVEKHLKIGLEFGDTHQLFGVPRSGFGFEPDILGAIYFEKKRIVIDESLDPDANPAKGGRYRFTLAHEVGHWQLHRDLFARHPGQLSLFNEQARPAIVCRSSQTKERIEVQADLYASCVLMPRKLVMTTWCDAFPGGKPRVLKLATPSDHAFVEFNRETFVTPVRLETETDDQALDRFAAPFAQKFLVSPVAMRIRLEKLGLLHREIPHQRILAGGA